MKRPVRIVLLALVAIVTGLCGYWCGFREGLNLGVAADMLPRASIATMQIEQLRNEHSKKVIDTLEFDVDNGLLWAHRIFNHPLRHVTGWAWGFHYYPEYEEYVRRLADYRAEHPSLMKTVKFDTRAADKELREFNEDLAKGTELNLAIIDAMVKTYASSERNK